MGLVEGQQPLGRDAHPFGHAAAIFRDVDGVVVRSGAAIAAFVNAAGHAAFASEKGVAQAGNGREQRRTQHHGVSASCVSSENPASATRSGCEIASTLNIEPMPPRPESISRFSAPEISAETSGVAFAISDTARVSMP